jgi:hypothetical protein
MGRRTAPRLALVWIALAACVVNLSFDMNQPGRVLQAPAAGPLLPESVLVDLGNSPDVRAHQKDITSLELEYVDVTITEIKQPGNAATNLSLTVALRKDMQDPPANDVIVGDVPNFTVQPNGTRRIAGNSQADAFLLDRLHDGGKFYVMLTGTTDGKTDLVLDVNLHASMGYESGLF